MANKITTLLVVALILLGGCAKQMTVVEGSRQESDSDSLSDNSGISDNSADASDASAAESDISTESDISDESTVLSESDTSGENDYSTPDNNQSEPDVSEPETSTPDVSEPDDGDLVLISEYIPNLKTDIRYATENNFTGKVIYNSADAYLRYGTVKKLIAVQAQLNKLGYELLIWDAYRPTEAQWKLWEICPDASFVSNPIKGYSSHSRGNTVDITVVRLDGTAVEMPSGFDEFTSLADRDYSDVSASAAENAKMLEEIMYQNGFTGYSKEWWHYTDTVKYDVVNP